MEGRQLSCCEGSLLQMSLFHSSDDYLEYANLLITVDNVLGGGAMGDCLEECH